MITDNHDIDATAIKGKSLINASAANADAGALNTLKAKIQEDHNVSPEVANRVANKVYSFKKFNTGGSWKPRQ